MARKWNERAVYNNVILSHTIYVFVQMQLCVFVYFAHHLQQGKRRPFIVNIIGYCCFLIEVCHCKPSTVRCFCLQCAPHCLLSTNHLWTSILFSHLLVVPSWLFPPLSLEWANTATLCSSGGRRKRPAAPASPTWQWNTIGTFYAFMTRGHACTPAFTHTNSHEHTHTHTPPHTRSFYVWAPQEQHGLLSFLLFASFTFQSYTPWVSLLLPFNTGRWLMSRGITTREHAG